MKTLCPTMNVICLLPDGYQIRRVGCYAMAI